MWLKFPPVFAELKYGRKIVLATENPGELLKA